MAQKRQWAGRAEASVVALSLLRLGSDTRAAAALKQITESVDQRGLQAPDIDWLMRRVAELVEFSPAQREGRIADARRRALAAAQRAEQHRISAVPWYVSEYPPLLREIHDPPILLWAVGDVTSLHAPAVAVVGSRRATPAGLAVARELGRGLAQAGFVVVSGLARGIDGAAHEGALDVGGRTVAVVGSGVDVIYPAEHRDLFARIAGAGAVVSEFPPGMPPRAHHFPLRNRIISGLSRAVVVVEASERSGSLITARLALEQGREVLSVPGSVASGRYTGSHALIKDGAALVETVEDVFNALGWTPLSFKTEKAQDKQPVLTDLERSMAAGEVYTPDQLVLQTGLSTSGLLAELGRLELAGNVQRVAGGGFVRIDKSAIGGSNG